MRGGSGDCATKTERLKPKATLASGDINQFPPGLVTSFQAKKRSRLLRLPCSGWIFEFATETRSNDGNPALLAQRTNQVHGISQECREHPLHGAATLYWFANSNRELHMRSEYSFILKLLPKDYKVMGLLTRSIPKCHLLVLSNSTTSVMLLIINGNRSGNFGQSPDKNLASFRNLDQASPSGQA